MRCPKCQFDHELQTTECLKCGIVFSKYHAAQEAAMQAASASEPLAAVLPLPVEPPQTNEAKQELMYRALALPLALLVARLMVGTGFRMPIRMLTMVLHESGHAVTSWLFGCWAVPMLWVTMHGDERSLLVVLAVMAALGYGGYWAWATRRWAWVAAAGGVLVLQMLCVTVWRFDAEAMIVFFGDGGALVFATILMAMFYAGRGSALYKSWGLRWGLLAIGAGAFMDVYLTWSGPAGDLPFGELEGVNLSDPSLLTDVFGWSVLTLIDRYLLLAKLCLIALGAIYAWGLVSTYWEMRSPASSADALGTAR